MKKMSKAMYGKSMMKKGGKVTVKKYDNGGEKKAYTMNPTSRSTAMTALGVNNPSNNSSPSRFGENANTTTSKKPKPAKAMYGMSMKPGMMKNVGTKKYAKGGEGELGPVYTQASGGKGGAGTYEPTKTTTTKTTKTYKTGGIIKAKKGIIMGPGDDDKKKKKSSTPPEFNTPIEKPEVDTAKKTYKNPLVARIGSYFTGKEYQKGTNPVTGMDVTRTYEDGKKTRVLKVKNQEEKKMGGAKKPKMMKGGAKPKAMYGTSMKSGMMKMGGAKKK